MTIFSTPPAFQRFGQVLLWLTLSLAWTATATTKTEALTGIVDGFITPGYQELAKAHRQLQQACVNLEEEPGAKSLLAAREAWTQAMVAGRKLEAVTFGPIALREYHSDFYYWQVFPFRIGEVIQQDRPVNRDWIELMGATSKGLFTIEFLLWDSTSAAEIISPGQRGPRRRHYASALAADLARKADELAADWSAKGPGTARAVFLDAGQESVNMVVNRICEFSERCVYWRLFLTLGMQQPERQLDRLEGGRSHTSHLLLNASIDGMRQLFEGGKGTGLDDYLSFLNPELGQDLQERWAKTDTAFARINEPLEAAVAGRLRPLVDRARTYCHALERRLVTDVVSALGVTLTFNSSDGD